MSGQVWCAEEAIEPHHGTGIGKTEVGLEGLNLTHCLVRVLEHVLGVLAG